MKIKIKAYNETADTFTIEHAEAGFFDIDASEIQLTDHDNAEEPIDMIDREIEASDFIESLMYGIG